MKYDVITFGSATQDVFMSSHDFKVLDHNSFETDRGLCVPLGSKIHMDSVFFSMGGCGTNAAVTFARQGHNVAYLGLIGHDVPGRTVRETLEKEGVKMELMEERKDNNTAYSVILSMPDVGRTILEKLGACHQMTEADIPFDKIDTDWFYLGPMSGDSHKSFKSVVEFATEKGIKISVNPGRTQLNEGIETLKSLLDHFDVLFVNQEEAARLTGLDYKQEKEIFRKLDDMVKGFVVMTKGPDGVTVSDGQNLFSAGIPESDLVDRTGAGDAFGSAFTSALIEKENDIDYAIQLGTANATAVLQEMGATNGLLEKGQWGPWEKVEVTQEKIDN